MHNQITALLVGAGLLLGAHGALATPEQDRESFVGYYQDRFPGVDKDEFVNGAYALDEDAYEQWQMIEDFPPYELAIEEGEQLFNTLFANGKGYADCFENGGIGIRQNYPYFDTETGKVKTLEQEINECREANGEKPYRYKKGKLAAISAYMAYTSRGNKLDIKIPDDPRAVEAYEDGKRFFYSKRGQLNFSCANCHVGGAGMRVRNELLSPALGNVTHFPVYRSKWGELGTLHRRFGGCNEQVRAKAFPAQSDEYRNLEYFLTYMSNGMEVNGPGARK